MNTAQWSWMEELPVDRFPEPYQSIAQEIGVENAVKIARMYAGMGLYFPKLDDVLIELRNAKIRAEFDGGNYKALARKYDLTERWIYQILGSEENKDQVSLFENS